MTLRRVLLFVGITGSLALAPVAGAGASPVSDKQAQAAAIQAQIDANGEKISAAAEAYNAAQLRVQQAENDMRNAQARIAANEAETGRLRGAVNDRAAGLYRSAVTGTGIEVSATDFASQEAAAKYAASATQRDEDVVAQLATSIEQLNVDQARFADAKTQAQAERSDAEKQRKAVESLNATQKQLLSQVKGEIATLIRQQEQERIAAAQAAAAARRTGGGTVAPQRRPTTNTEFPTDLPPPSGYAAGAIAFARAQLGKPYQYAASGPDSYDCSGLTMAAYGSAGLSLPHYSGAQYAMFPHVPLDQLQPGDLVFRGPGGSQHVSLYIGNGLVITAPQTGDVVKVAPMGRVIGASRPG